MRLGIVLEKNWALPVDQGWLQALQLSVHLISWPSVLLRYNGFSGIQKAVVDQTGSRPPVCTKRHCDLFFGASLALGHALELLNPTTELVITDCHRNSTFYFMSQSSQEMVRCCVE